MLHEIILGKGDHYYKYVILDYLSYEWEIKLFCREIFTVLAVVTSALNRSKHSNIVPFICVIMLLSFDRFDTIHHSKKPRLVLSTPISSSRSPATWFVSEVFF